MVYHVLNSEVIAVLLMNVKLTQNLKPLPLVNIC